ncbi:Uncharacterized protein FWK35_00008543 [Aphis craccivora]|uniref:Uncharacterized protein n=1 Tax=Aphis craccivora TaxID=307492 RepID=A0A6G0ZAF7_APHCR|nr:Uncharacterized protein FWK35_00008543 [Aphis craccivora]
MPTIQLEIQRRSSGRTVFSTTAPVTINTVVGANYEKKKSLEKSEEKRSRGRPRKKFLDVVEENLKALGVKEWNAIVKDQER